MKKNVYKGLRYVPKIIGTWDYTKNTEYESLSIVQWKGLSFTSKKLVPAGIDIYNEEYWVITGNYNYQVESYRKLVIDHLKKSAIYFKDIDSSKIDKNGNTFCSLHERLDFIDSKLSDVTSKNIKSLGCVGDGITDNSKKFKEIIENLKDYDTIFIPEGNYLIDIHESDLIDIGMTGKPSYAYCSLKNLKNITITGNGSLTITSKYANKKTVFLHLNKCSNFTMNGLNVLGDCVFNETATIDDKYLNGFYLEECNNSKIINNNFFNILAVLSVTGDVKSPSESGVVSNNNIIQNNLFYNYGQITTYGGGTSKLIFQNNIMVNPLQCGFKLSTNVKNIVNNDSNHVIINNNIITWERNYKFGIVGWNTSKKFNPCGIMIEGHTDKIKISNNIIDYSLLESEIENPIQVVTCISLMRGNENENLQCNNISIENNSLYAHKTKRECLTIAPFYKNLFIKNNQIDGTIVVNTSSEINDKNILSIKDNNFLGTYSPIGISLRKGKYKTIEIDNNTFSSSKMDSVNGYDGYIEISQIEGNSLSITNNNLKNSDILSYSNYNVNFESINIKNNILRYTVLYANLVKNIYYNYNTVICNKSSLIIKGNSELNVDFSYNSGNVTGSILTIDVGNVTCVNNSINFKSGVPYNLGESKVLKGNIISNKTPEGNVNAMMGVMCVNYGTTKDGIFVKNTIEGNTGWKQL